MLKNILALGLMVFGLGLRGQAILDTIVICVDGNSTSNLAVQGDPSITYHWNINGGNILAGQGTNDVTVFWYPVEGLYLNSVYTTSAEGCPGDTQYAYVYIKVPIHGRVAGPDAVCVGEWVTLEAQGSGLALWNGVIASPVISFLVVKDTTVMLVTQHGPCGYDTSYHDVKASTMPVAKIGQSVDSVYRNQRVVFTNEGTFAAVQDWYVDGSKIGSGKTIEHQFRQLGEYEVLLVTENGSCTDTARRMVVVDGEFNMAVPDAFTPNGDGINDIFYFKAEGYSRFIAAVYNRWGEMLYTWDDTPENGWNGYHRGEVAQQDVYVFKVVLEDYLGRKHEHVGEVKLIR
jgi:gliding motility-associated-like protein